VRRSGAQPGVRRVEHDGDALSSLEALAANDRGALLQHLEPRARDGALPRLGGRRDQRGRGEEGDRGIPHHELSLAFRMGEIVETLWYPPRGPDSGRSRGWGRKRT